MSKYDESKKGARFTMCKAALQGGADISIVPKIMEYIETGKEDVLKYVSPCEDMEKKIADSNERHEELRGKLASINEAFEKLELEYKEAKSRYLALKSQSRSLQEEIGIEYRSLPNMEPGGGNGWTRSGVATTLSGMSCPLNTRVFAQLGNYLISVNGVKYRFGKPIIVLGGDDSSTPKPICRILSDGTLEAVRGCKEQYEEIYNMLGTHMLSVREITGDNDMCVPRRFTSLDGAILSVSE